MRAIRLGLLALGILVIAGYAIWRSLNYARGPGIVLSEPASRTTTSETLLHLRGKAVRAVAVLLNGKLISVDEAGTFDETVILFPGLNTWELEAKDQFGRSNTTRLDIWRTEY